MRKRLIFRVDDLGYTPGYDAGAERAFEEGVGTSADVMFDSKDCIEILKWLKDRPWLSIGWHRHLWERPVLPAEEVPSLVNEEGRFKWGHRHQELMQEATYEDARKEFEAEMKLCYEYLGRYPDTAGLRNDDIPLEHAFQDVLDEYGITYNYFVAERKHKNPDIVDEKYKNLNIICKDIATGKGFALEYFNVYEPLKTMMNVQWTEKEEIYFYGWHPGYCDEYIMRESTCNLHRCKELEAMISPELKDWILANHIELINQRDAIHGTNEYQNHLKVIDSPLYIGNMK